MTKHFTQVQQEFMQHIRNPAMNAAPDDIEDRRMKIYRELFFNNVVGFINNSFPVLKSLYPQEQWLGLAREFFATHDCRSPYFVDISKEFVEFLSNEYQLKDSDPAFMLELAHYEWVELAVSVSKAQSDGQFWQQGQQQVSHLTLNPTAWVLSYQYPVHQISEEFQPMTPGEQPVYLVVYRDEQDEVQFVVINAITAHLLNVIEQAEVISVDELGEQMKAALPQLSDEQLNTALAQVLQQMFGQGIVLLVDR